MVLVSEENFGKLVETDRHGIASILDIKILIVIKIYSNLYISIKKMNI
jgi:hypothetical protein